MELFLAFFAIALGLGIIGYFFAEGFRERSLRLKHQGIFLPLINAPLKHKGSRYFQRYEVLGSYQGRQVEIMCPLFSLFNNQLSVFSVSVELKNFRETSVIAGAKFQYQDQYYSVLKDMITFGDGEGNIPNLAIRLEKDSEMFLQRVTGKLDTLCQIAEKIDQRELDLEFLSPKG